VVSAFNSLGESAKSNEISVRPGAFVAAVNCGGRAVSQFAADTNYVGGTTSATEALIDTKGLVAPAPPAVYQTDRWGHDFTYTFTGLTAGVNYTVRLHFVEFHFSETGQRIFNVAINGAPRLTNFDILAVTHAKNAATIREFTMPADAAGKITIQFTPTKDNPKCSGIELLASSS